MCVRERERDKERGGQIKRGGKLRGPREGVGFTERERRGRGGYLSDREEKREGGRGERHTHTHTDV